MKKYINFLLIAVLILTLTAPFAFSANAGQDTKDATGKSGAKSSAYQIPIVGTKDKFIKIMKERAPKYSVYPYLMINESMDMEMVGAPESPEFGASEPQSESDYSATNIQVAGVDEGDIIKTDGKYIYQANINKIVILQAYPADEMKIISEIEYNRGDRLNSGMYPIEIYVDGNTLAVIGGAWEDKTYKYYTKALIYDITDRSNPRKTREVALEGNYLSSRKVDDCLYVVSNKYMNYYPIVHGKDIDFENAVPVYSDSAVSDKFKKVDFADMRYFPNDDDLNHTFIAGIKIDEPERPADISSYLGSGQLIYCGKENLYIAKPVYNYHWSFNGHHDEKTEIYRFAIDNGKVSFEKKGTVKGQPLNQFSMDEYAGYFRIATTINSYFENEMSNSLYVLSAETLEMTGKIENIAPGERIYSVRFMGEKGYMVTFRTVDPLFAIDLSDPAKPEILGELKIPGFSQYLHPYDENHIIGFGVDTEVIRDNWNGFISERVVQTGMKMALFDVSDPISPKEKFSVKVGDRGTYSEILYNHRALLFSKEKNIIAFPVAGQGALVYGLDLEKGFTLKGGISHATHAEISRILYIGDVLYTSATDMIKASEMDTLKEIKSIDIIQIR